MILSLWLAACAPPSPEPLVAPAPAGNALPAPSPSPSARRASAALADGGTLSVSLDLPEMRGDEATLAGAAELSPPTSPTRSLLFTLDVSASVMVPGEGCGGDFNEDGLVDTVLDCELAGAWEVIQRAESWGDVGEVGFVVFQVFGRIVDLGPASGAQRFTTPSADADGDTEADLLTVLRSMGYIEGTWRDPGLGVEEFTRYDVTYVYGGTNFREAFDTTCALLSSAAYPNRLDLFLSDGQGTFGGSVTDVLPCVEPVTVEAVGIVPGACDADPDGYGSMREIAALQGGDCVEVSDPEALADALAGPVVPAITRATLTVGDAEPVDVSGHIIEGLPWVGAGEVHFADVVSGLVEDTLVCLTVEAEAAGTTTSATDCQIAEVNQAPELDAPDAWTVEEGALFALEATASDADGDALTWAWSTTGPYPLVGARTATPSLYALDDGAFELVAEVSDGQVATSSVQSLVVANVAPTLDVTLSAGEVALLQVAFTDPGVADTHRLAVDWGDGASESADAAVDGPGWGLAVLAHRYAATGVYTVALTLADDDGGESTWSGSVTVDAPVALFATGTTDDALSTAGGTLVGHVHSNGGVTLAGVGTVDGPVEYVTTVSIGADQSLSIAPVGVSVSDPPRVWSVADYRPDGVGALAAGVDYHDQSETCVGLVRWRVSEALAPGVYYAPCDIELRADQTGVTLVSEGSVYVTAGGVAGGFVDGLAALAGEDLSIGSEGATWIGALAAPTGTITLGGSGNEVVGSVVGERIVATDPDVRVEGSDPTPTGSVAPIGAPRVSAEVGNDLAEALPGQPVGTLATLRHEGVDLVLPAVVVATNRGDAPATLVDATLALEVWDGADWVALDAEAGGVGGLPEAGASLAMGESRTWTVWRSARLDPSGWASVAGAPVRARVITEWSAGDRVETSAPLGDPATLPEGADVTGAEVWLAGIDGVLDAVDVGTLAPGDAATAERVATWTAPAPGDGERADAWLARLEAEDGAPLTAMAMGRATGGVGAVVAAQEITASTATLPIVSLEVEAPTGLVAGSASTTEVTTANDGSADGSAAWSCTLGGAASGEGALLPGEIRTDSVVLVPDAAGAGELICEWSWIDDLGTTYGPIATDVDVVVGAPGSLTVSLSDQLLTDADSDGAPSLGDTLRYVLSAANTGDATLTDVRLELPVDPASTVLDGAADGGGVTLAEGGAAVAWGALAGGASVGATVDVVVTDAVAALSVQGTAFADGVESRTDDPSVEGTADATVTPLWTTSPTLAATLAARLRVDADRDGGVSPGDTLGYTLTLGNPGARPVSGATVWVPAPVGGALVAGSVTTTRGAVTADASEVGVDVGDLGSTEGASIGFEVSVTGAAGEQVVVQGALAATDVAGLTDDPTTSAEDDATAVSIGGIMLDDGAAPVVAWTSPEAGARIAVPTALSASVTTADGADPSSWTLERVSGAGEATVLATGTGAPLLDDLDPTLLANGLWTLRLTAVDAGGRVGEADLPLEVQGMAKLGAYDVAFVDAQWQSGAFSVEVRREYRTVRRDEVGAFGHGWSLSLADFELQRNGVVGDGGWRQEGCGSGFVFASVCTVAETPHLVAVRWPDGRVEAFDVTPGEGSSFFSSVVPVAYTARGGATSTLEPVEGEATAAFLDGSLYTGLDFRTLYDPQQVWLTDRDGMRYRIDRDDGLVETVDRDGNVTTYGPDGVVPERGEPLTWTRDDAGRIVSIDLPDGGAVVYTYDAAGDLVGVVDGAGRASTFTYDDHLLVAYGTEGAAPIATQTYDADGRLVASEDASGVFTEHTSDLEAWTETTVGPDPALTTVVAYDADGLLTSVTRSYDGASYTWSWGWDDRYRPVVETTPSGATTEVAYDEAGRVTDVVDADGVVSELAWTELGDLTEVWVGGALVHAMVYDDAGHPLEATSPTGATLATWAWTEWGGPSSWVDADGVSGSAELDEDGGLSALVSAERRLGLVKDAWGTAVGLSDALGGFGTAELDASGRELSFTDANGATRFWVYDAQGWLTSATDKLGRSDVYTRDDSGRVTSWSRRGGATVAYTYDEAGRVARIDGGDTWVAYVYDAVGRVVVVENADVVVEATYDVDGNVASVSTRPTTAGRFPEATTTYSWTPAGRLSSASNDWGVVSWTWDAQGRLAAQTDSLTGTWTYGYDADGRLATVSRSDGLRTTYGYTPAGRLESVTTGDATTTLSYDASGRIAAREDAAGAHAFVYDERGRLTTATHASGVADEAFAYDLNGNRGDGPSPVDQLASDGRWTYTWDADGRMAGRTDGSETTTYTWNVFDALVSVSAPEGTTTFVYDGLGRRVELSGPTGTWSFVYQGEAVQGVLDGDGALWSWSTHGPDGELLAEWRPEGIREAARDERGTRTGWWSEGAWTWSWRSAFGAGESPEEVEASAYTWHAADPTGLVYMRARYYDAEIGRFLSEDPLPAANLYGYAGGDPVNFWDPTGMSAVEYGTNASGDAKQVPPEQKLGQELACEFAQEAELINQMVGQAGCVTDIVATGCEARVGGRGGPGGRGGVYRLIDPDTGDVVRTGRTKKFVQRQYQHLQDPILRKYDFDPVFKADRYAAQRGLEALIHRRYAAPLNRIRPISPKSRNLCAYLRAAQEYLQ